MSTDKYTERDLEKIAGRFSNINVDEAWNKVRSEIGKEGLVDSPPLLGERNRRITFLRIAAAVILIIGLGAGFLYLRNSVTIGDRVIIASGGDERDVVVTLSDGSKVWLNRNSKLIYRNSLNGETRNVKLTGEAFFDITPDPKRPFIIDAGKAKVKVVGTSFNVITSNRDNKVEVFVRTGKVMLSDPSGVRSIMIELGSVGIIGASTPDISVNENRNYMAWKTDTLVYQGEKLDVVFADLKRVFDINISADDPEINNIPLTTTFFSLPEDTIIQVICNTFNLRYEKNGSVYHLAK
jgi:ferric-dicitrate binding protein FerR (iron transport regulator)